MTRVVAGSARGRRLQVPPGSAVRPTPDRVKEALFSSLGDLHGHRVLDLYAGSGGLGIEALSRGAEHAVLVEADRTVAKVLRRNLAVTGVADRATVVVAPAERFVRDPVGGPFTVVFVDAPYDVAEAVLHRLVGALHAAGQLADGARVVIERDRRRLAADRPDTTAPLAHRRDRTYGDVVLRTYETTPREAAS